MTAGPTSGDGTGARTVLLAAGGTGGHVFPGLATAAALRRADADLAIEFVGTADRLEARLVPEAGWTLHAVPAMALARRVSPATLKLPGVLLRSVRQVSEVMTERRVVAAVGFGGYTSVPLALAARLRGIPLVVHEQNAVPGIANRLAARVAAVVAITFDEARDGFGRTRVELTGNPVRPDLLAALGDHGDPATARRTLRDEGLTHFGLDPLRRTLLVFGGSQGALRINRAVIASATRWADPTTLQILHAAGSRTFADTDAAWAPALEAAPDLRVRCHEFISRMDLAYAVADVVVCRAGASSIAELTALGLPAVLVPYPHATADHQTANARAVERAGAAVMVPDDRMDAAALVAAAQPLLSDDGARAAMGAAAAAWGRPDAADRLASIALEVARPDASPTSPTRPRKPQR